MHKTNHEHWLREAGETIAAKRRATLEHGSTPRDDLIFSLWLTANSMRRAGDLTHARAVCPAYRASAAQAAVTLALPLASAAFSASEGTLERRFFDLFDDLCRELRDA